MYCKKCGAENDDNSHRCIRCNDVVSHVEGSLETPGTIPNYLAQSILLTLFCCIPFGAASIVFSTQVNSKVQAGDIRGALESSRKAKLWCWLAFGVGLLSQIIYGFFLLLGSL